jgi:hypothetical protein
MPSASPSSRTSHTAAQGRAATNEMAGVAKARFADDRAMSAYYNEVLAGGKWRGFQTQSKIGYGGPYPDSSWQQPQDADGRAIADFIWPALRRIEVPAGSGLGVAIDGSASYWPAESSPAILTELSPFQRGPAPYIEVFNRGREAFAYRIEAAVPWIRVAPARGTVTTEVRATVRVDWASAPKGALRVPIVVTGAAKRPVVVQAVIRNPPGPAPALDDFVESDGYVSMEAEHFARAAGAPPISWMLLPDIGRTGSGMTPIPVTSVRQSRASGGPRLEYKMHLFTTGPVVAWAYLSPRNDVLHSNGLKYAVSTRRPRKSSTSPRR